MEWAPHVQALLAGFTGLLLGSFLNVVIHRLPKMLERQWAEDCASMHPTSPDDSETVLTAYNLVTPRSSCPHCGAAIKWFRNVPVVSFVLLGGKCADCGAPISFRYPMVEIITGILFAWCGWNWGITPTGVMWAGFSATLVALAFIDWDTTLLPDDLTLPLIWTGLCGAALGWTGTTSLEDALWGAVAGYLSLWTVYWAFKLATGKEGMGYGDFKLFGAFGAWFGWQALIPIILMASVFGAVVGIAMKLNSSLREGGYVPFGPFLALGGLTAMLTSPRQMLELIGL